MIRQNPAKYFFIFTSKNGNFPKWPQNTINKQEHKIFAFERFGSLESRVANPENLRYS